MRHGSPSMTTTTVPVKDVRGRNERWFPVSVCCATCLCHFWAPKKSDRFYYGVSRGQHVLYRRGPSGDELVQYLQAPSQTREGSEAVQAKHKGRYLTHLSYGRVEGVCRLAK